MHKKEHSYLWDVKNPKGYKNRMGSYKTRIQLDFILKQIKEKKMRILDIGGGSGRFAIPIKLKGHDVTVIELDNNAINLLKKREDKIKTILMDFNDFITDTKYDIIICMEVLQYFPSYCNSFKRIFDMLKNDGIFIFTVVNSSSWRYFLRKLKKHTNYNITSYRDYLKLLKSNNFRIINKKGFQWIPLTVNSNSRMVLLFSYLEKILFLDKCFIQSPYLLFAVRKNS